MGSDSSAASGAGWISTPRCSCDQKNYRVTWKKWISVRMSG